jgi:signal transduction histidine kinase
MTRTRRFRLGLRPKFFLYSNTVIAITMGLATLLVVVHDRRRQYEALERRGRSVAEALAIPITDALMYEELGLAKDEGRIDNYITEILTRNLDQMRYVIVADADGVVTHSNRWELLGRPFERALGRAALAQAPSSEILDSVGDERILEIREPLAITTKFWGSLTVGFSLEPIERDFEVIASRLVAVALLVIIGNSVMTAVYMESLIRPILDLYQIMKRAGRGDLTVRAEAARRDEMGGLAEAFNRMMKELEDARALEKVRQSQLAHTEKMAAIGTLAAGVAHEVNNPLGGVLTCIDNMRADPDDREMRERYLELIHDGIKRIERTVANLLNLSRQRGMHPEPTSINHNLRHVAELTAYQLRKAGVDVRFELDPDEPRVMADHFQMEQLFLNLVLNALQAMPQGGTLTLRTSRRDAVVVAEVSDSGVGIPEAVRDRIFDPFFTTREVGAGTGLGLAVSDSIVAAHGGRIEVDSRVGEGTAFRVTLPVLPEPAAQEEA